MRYMLDLPSGLVERIYANVGERDDFTLRSFILMAIENQLEMEAKKPPAGEGTPARAEEDADPRVSSEVAELVGEPPALEPCGEMIGQEQRSDTMDAEGTPWLWGQVNRVLPIKFSLRVLANADEGSGLALEEAQTLVASAGRTYGFYLRNLDDLADRGRTDRLSVGFPTADSEEDAMSRFRSHYLGHRRKDGRVAGASFTLGLVGACSGNRIGLTDAGATFARLENPVLDTGRNGHPTLSDQEVDVYLRHCLERVPGEAKAFATILSGVVEGRQSTDGLNSLIGSTVGRDWTDTMVSTQRSGTMGRMIELGLIERERQGRRVKFTATERGREFLRSSGLAS